MAEFGSVVQKFISENQSDLSSDGKLHVCIGGGGGFIGSHIAKRLKEEVNIFALYGHFENLYHLFIIIV
jgi:hypothetical protein